MAAKVYRSPEPTNIGRTETTSALYHVEETRNNYLKFGATKLCDLHGWDPDDVEDYWGKAIPQALYDTLCQFDRRAARAAALAFLRDETAGLV